MKTKEKFTQYADLLREWSGRINLVAPSTLDDIHGRHIADSAQLGDVLPHDVHIIDMGAGAGFPGVVLAILGWRVTAIESVGKKVAFLNAIKQELDLPNLTVFHGRVEDYIKKIKPSTPGVVFTARAFAPLIKILDFVAVTKYRLFLLKGRGIESEIRDAQTRYKFDYELIPSKTGDGFIAIISKIH